MNLLLCLEIGGSGHKSASGHVKPKNEVQSHSGSRLEVENSGIETYNREEAFFLSQPSNLQIKRLNEFVFPELNAEDFCTNTPQQVDLRTMGLIPKSVDEGTCGSCYAHTFNTVLTNLLLRDLMYYRSNPDYNTTELMHFNSDTRFSVDYLLNNSLSNDHCAGGNMYMLSDDFVRKVVYGVEMDQIYPYYSFSLKSDYRPFRWPNKLEQKSEFNKHAFDPTFHFNDAEREPRIPEILYQYEMLDPETNQSKPDNIQLTKAILARGVAVATDMYLPDTFFMRYKLKFYKKGVINDNNYPCTEFSTNHLAVIVGYGKYKGVDVWIVQNSWGMGFGKQGSFFIEIGSNALCSELCEYAILPRYFRYNESLEPIEAPFSESEAYEEGVQEGVYFNAFTSVIDGVTGLDVDSRSSRGYQADKTTGQQVVAYTVVIAMAAALVTDFIYEGCRPHPKILERTVYLPCQREQFDVVSAECLCKSESKTNERPKMCASKKLPAESTKLPMKRRV